MIPLRLDYALRIALRNNLGAISESSSVRQAEARRTIAASELRPQLSSVISETVEQLNLRTLGVESNAFPPIVGPFNFFDARAARLRYAVLDFVRTRNLQSAEQNVQAANLAARDAKDLIVLAVAGTYLQIIAANARIAAAAAQVRTSQAVYQQAVDRLNEGLNARIDTTRSRVQMQIDRQHLRSLVADRDRQKLRLSRLIGLPLGQDFDIADDFSYAPVLDLTPATAMDRAQNDRSDLKAAQASVRAAEAALKAARAERLPNLTLAADYGVAGLRPTASAHGVFTVAGTLTIPLYQGGRVRGDVEQADAVVRQRRSEMEDVRGRIDEEVRQSFIDLNAAADQVDVARSNVDLAEDTLRQARDRFIEGISDTVEVVQAEQSTVQAHDDFITAVFNHNLAKVSLARAMGNAEQTLPQMLVRK